MDNCASKTNTGEGVKDKEVRTTSDDAGGKSVSQKSKSVGAKCVSENSTGGKSGTTRNGSNPFETSRKDKPQYFVDVVKDKHTHTTCSLTDEPIHIHFPLLLTQQNIRTNLPTINLVDKRSLLIRSFC